MRWLALALIVPILAGCISSGVDEQRGRAGLDASHDPATHEGAIAGLVVDDRFRPVAGATVIARPDDWVARTDASGQFSFVDLRPDTYTLVVGAEGHEAAPTEVDVVPGAWTEATVMARRTAGVSDPPGRIVTEYTLWQSCTLSGVTFSTNCGYVIGDNVRTGNVEDYTHLDNVGELVVELRFDRPGRFQIRLGEASGCDDQGYQCDHYEWIFHDVIEESYAKVVLPHQETRNVSRFEASGSWRNEHPATLTFWPVGDLDTGPATEQVPLPLPFESYGAGFAISHHVDIAQTVFVGDHGIDVEAYCVYCSA